MTKTGNNSSGNPCNKYYQKIEDYKNYDLFVIFYMKGCPFCQEALDTLEQKDRSYKAYQIERSPVDKLPKLLGCLHQNSSATGFSTNHKTVPIVFYQGKFIGGLDKLKKYLANQD